MKLLNVGLLLLAFAACGQSGNHGFGVSKQRVEVEKSDHRSRVESNQGDEVQIESDKLPITDTDNEVTIDQKMPKKIDAPKLDVDNRPFGVGGLSEITGKTDDPNDSQRMIVSYDVCTATFLDSGEVITAAHCLPKKVRDQIGKEGACSSVSFIHAAEAQPFRCQKILWSPSVLKDFEFSNKITDEGVYSDIVIFKTASNPTKIKPMKLSATFADTKENYKAWVYAPPPENETQTNTGLSALPAIIKKGLNFIFKEHPTCGIVDDSAEGYPYRIFNCPIVHGNSGAPLINSKNELQGVIDGFIDNGSSGYITDTGCLEKNFEGLYQWKKSCPAHGFLQKNK